MAQQTINVGTAPNDGTGTPLRTAFQYTNSNFSELYTAVGPSGNNIVVPGNATITGDLTVATDALKVNSSTKDICIGTTTPTFNNKLTVVGGAGGDAFITSGNGTRTGYIGTDGTNVIMGAYSNHPLRIHVNDYPQMEVAALGVFNWYDGAGGTRMTLNSTGLGVGASPAANSSLTVYRANSNSALRVTNGPSANNVGITLESLGGNVVLNNGNGPLEVSVGGSLRATIDTSGNVGIGVTPSATWASNRRALQIGGLASGAVALNGTGGSGEIFFNSFFNTSTQNICLVTGGTGKYDFNVSTVGAHSWSVGTGTAGNAFTFTQAMTLDASGNLLVGTTTAAAKITALAGASGQAAIFQQPAQNFWCVLAHNQATSGDNSFVLFGTEASFTSRGSITYNRAAGLVAYNITSDYRLKEDVKPLTGALNRISSLKPSTYKFKETGFTCEGFIAHELAEVIPAAVTGEKDAVNEDGSIKAQGVDLSKVVPILVAAIQELTARVQTLETR